MGFAADIDAKIAAGDKSGFVLSLKGFKVKAEKQFTAVPHAIAMRMYTDIIMLTPVDTGRARANWMLACGKANTGTTESTDKTGQSTAAQAASQLAGLNKGQSIFITNSLPYIMRLEYGWSKQAPNGMVRQTVERFQAMVNKAIAECSK